MGTFREETRNLKKGGAKQRSPTVTYAESVMTSGDASEKQAQARITGPDLAWGRFLCFVFFSPSKRAWKMDLSLRSKKRGVKFKNAFVRSYCQQPGQFICKFDVIIKQQPEVVGSITSFISTTKAVPHQTTCTKSRSSLSPSFSLLYNNRPVSGDVSIDWAVLLLHILEVSGSCLGSETAFPIYYSLITPTFDAI